MIKDYLEIGQIVGTHGVRGELRVQRGAIRPNSSKSSKRFTTTHTVKKAWALFALAPHGNIALLRLDGCDTVKRRPRVRGKVPL